MSLFEKDYYPAGAYNDPSAPWNEVEPPTIKVAVTSSITKTFEVAQCDEDDSELDCFINSGELTLGNLLKKTIQHLNNLGDRTSKYLANELSEWDEVDYEVD